MLGVKATASLALDKVLHEYEAYSCSLSFLTLSSLAVSKQV